MTRDPQKLGPVVWAVRQDPQELGWDGGPGTSRPLQTREKVGTEALPQPHQPWPQSRCEVLEERSALNALAPVWLRLAWSWRMEGAVGGCGWGQESSGVEFTTAPLGRKD